MSWILIWLHILGLCPLTALSGYCYSCAGICTTEPCNCQMGSCESDYCYIEKRPEPSGDLRIIKGCIRKPSRRLFGCDYVGNKESIACTCSGDFCNDVIHMMPQLRRNITCKHCDERDSDCGNTCIGQWCYESTSGKTGCGFGPPSLPFFYETHELLMSRSKVCMTISRGNGVPEKMCICNTHLCNELLRNQPMLSIIPPQQRHRSVPRHPYEPPKIHKCISCDVSTHDSSITSSCRQNSCYGHYCTYNSQRILVSGLSQRSQTQAIINERQGCINVTDHRYVKLGCLHKWTNNEEELRCLCAGNDCNVDLTTASSASLSTLFLGAKLITCFLLLIKNYHF